MSRYIIWYVTTVKTEKLKNYLIHLIQKLVFSSMVKICRVLYLLFKNDYHKYAKCYIVHLNKSHSHNVYYQKFAIIILHRTRKTILFCSCGTLHKNKRLQVDRCRQLYFQTALDVTKISDSLRTAWLFAIVQYSCTWKESFRKVLLGWKG